jgi:hypothetical protein
MKKHCGICNRELNVDSDPLSGDCGGDCWGCIGEIEACAGYEMSLKLVREEYVDGLRPNWMPDPIITTRIRIGENRLQNIIEFKVMILHPLGNPHENQFFKARVFEKHSSMSENRIINEYGLKTNSKGVAEFECELINNEMKQDIWIEIERNHRAVSFPVEISGG